MSAPPASESALPDGVAPYRDLSVSAASLGSPIGSHHAGEVIGSKYRLDRLLCYGGMGSVWLAYNQALDVEVAIKLVRPDANCSFVNDRFLTEARLSARLEHPAIVGVHDLGHTESGEPYLVMELLHGEDLRTVIDQQQKLPPVDAVQLMLPIAEGLASAHAEGVVHRDLKPENVFLARSGDRLQPKILDFGIAKATLTPGQRRITHVGAVIGSPDYMSPEQARGLDADHRADIWAFCSVLYELVTGQTPFADSAADTLLRDIVGKAPLPIARLGVEDDALWQILEKGLAKDREHRYDDMQQIGQALVQWLLAQGTETDVCGHSLRAKWTRESDSQSRLAARPAVPAESGSQPVLRIERHFPDDSCPAVAEPTASSSRHWRPSLWRPSTGRPGGRLRTLTMLACASAAGAAAMHWAPLADAAGTRLRAGAMSFAAHRAARHEVQLHHRSSSAERTAPANPADTTEEPQAALAACTTPAPKRQVLRPPSKPRPPLWPVAVSKPPPEPPRAAAPRRVHADPLASRH